MMSAPDMVGGTYDSLDTALMQRRPGRLLAKGGADGMQALGVIAGDGRTAAGIALKIEDGDLSRRATNATSVEALAQLGLLDERDLRALAASHHPAVTTPAGDEAATAVPRFVLDGVDRMTS
jgi:L-asparaginase II